VPPGQHLAEKLHAYVRDYGGISSRAKDLYDMLAIADGLPLPSAAELAEACRQTYALRHSVWPPELPPPPEEWEGAWRGFVDAYAIRWRSLDDAYEALEAFWSPVFEGRPARWDATEWSWIGAAPPSTPRELRRGTVSSPSVPPER
jgi:hypothetical protein